jgi:hypothetical protein
MSFKNVDRYQPSFNSKSHSEMINVNFREQKIEMNVTGFHSQHHSTLTGQPNSCIYVYIYIYIHIYVYTYINLYKYIDMVGTNALLQSQLQPSSLFLCVICLLTFPDVFQLFM